MLRVAADKPCKLVYSLAKHEYFGFLIEPHIVQLNLDGDFSLTHQRLFTSTASEFSAWFDNADHKLIKLCEEVEQDYIIKKLFKKTVRATEFFAKIWDDKSYDFIRPKIEKKLAEVLKLLKTKVFL